MAEKIFTYVFMAVGIVILLLAAGIPTTSNYVLSQMGFTSPSAAANFQASAFYGSILFYLGLMAALTGIIIVGLLGRGQSDLPITALLASAVLILFIGDFVSLIAYANNYYEWGGWLVFLVVAPFIVGYILALYDWTRGKD